MVQINVGRGSALAASIAALIASGSWPSTAGITCQPVMNSIFYGKMPENELEVARVTGIAKWLTAGPDEALFVI